MFGRNLADFLLYKTLSPIILGIIAKIGKSKSDDLYFKNLCKGTAFLSYLPAHTAIVYAQMTNYDVLFAYVIFFV